MRVVVSDAKHYFMTVISLTNLSKFEKYLLRNIDKYLYLFT
jgi:hypothetical protein